MPRKNGNPPKRSPNSKKYYDDEDDDSSVDSKGNIRNLIDYDYDENDNESEESEQHIVKRKPRKAAIRAMRTIRKKTEPGYSESRVVTKSKASKVFEVKTKDKKKNRKEMKRDMLADTSDEDDVVVNRKKLRKNNTKLTRVCKEETEEDTEYNEDEDEDYSSDYDESVEDDESNEDDEFDEDDESDEDYESEDDNARKTSQRIGLMISGFGTRADPKEPKKYKMKEQPSIVKKFVKLVQKGSENEENTNNIDTDISYFKNLPDNKQNMIIDKMERKFSMDETAVPLKFKILEKQVPQQVEKLALGKYHALLNMDTSSTEYYKGFHWIEGYSNLPLGVYKELPVKLADGPEACSNFVTKVRENMDDAIFGHDDAKLQILQFVSSWIANPKGIGNVLSIHGPMGVGKTTLVKNGIAKALDRPFHFITLGGASDASFLDGHSYTYEGSTWGRIADILIQSKCMNPIIYFDELDKISETPKGEEIMNLLIHITDTSQNDKFQDKYFTGIDLDLSRCLFIFSHNNHERVNPILRDRMYNIRVSGFNLKEKQVIAEQYLIDQTLKEIGLYEKLSIDSDVVQHIIENYTGDEKGVRELKRCIHTIMSKLNLLRFYNDPKKVPFAIPDFSLPFTLKKEHLKLLLNKPSQENESWRSLYN
jgi:ATP-dependent Lon protease